MQRRRTLTRWRSGVMLGGKPRAVVDVELHTMFERFTDRARQVVVLAQDEARMLHHDYIGTEHLLLGLLREGEGVAAQVLESRGASLDAVRQQVTATIGQGQRPPSGHIPFTRGAKKMLELSLREALQPHHDYIGTEHLLLGLIAAADSAAAQELVRYGLDLGRARAMVAGLVPAARPDGGQAAETNRLRAEVARLRRLLHWPRPVCRRSVVRGGQLRAGRSPRLTQNPSPPRISTRSEDPACPQPA